jgi:hypothetical protein
VLVTLPAHLQSPLLDVMNFLNDATVRYPDAISLAPGRPPERLFHVAEGLERAGVVGRARPRAAAGRAPAGGARR